MSNLSRERDFALKKPSWRRARMRTDDKLADAIALRVKFSTRTGVNDCNSTHYHRWKASRHFLQLLFAQLFEFFLLCVFHDLSSLVFFYDLISDVKIRQIILPENAFYDLRISFVNLWIFFLCDTAAATEKGRDGCHFSSLYPKCAFCVLPLLRKTRHPFGFSPNYYKDKMITQYFTHWWDLLNLWSTAASDIGESPCYGRNISWWRALR